MKCKQCGYDRKKSDDGYPPSECPICGLRYDNDTEEKISQPKRKKEITLSSILAWGFGLLFLFVGIGSLFVKPISGILFLIMAIPIFPPITNLLENRFNISFSKNAKFAIFFVSFLIFSGLELNKEKQKQLKKEQKQQEIELQQKKIKQKQLAKIQKEKIERQRIKRIEYKRNRAKRDRKRAEELKKAHIDASKFKTTLFDMLSKKNINIVQNVHLNKDRPHEIIIVMKPIWHNRNKHLRKNDATVFWELWASINNPQDPDSARIKLVSINNDRVGGSKWLAGSLIWVED